MQKERSDCVAREEEKEGKGHPDSWQLLFRLNRNSISVFGFLWNLSET